VWNAVGTGFFVTEQFLPEQPQEVSLEHKAAALAEVIRLAVEAPGQLDPDILRAVAPRAIELFDRMCVERDPATTTPAQQPPEQ
jgi:hypothetical protein